MEGDNKNHQNEENKENKDNNQNGNFENLNNQEPLSEELQGKVNSVDKSMVGKFFGNTKEAFQNLSSKLSKVIPFTKVYRKIKQEKFINKKEAIEKTKITEPIKRIDPTSFENELRDYDNQLRNIEQQLNDPNFTKLEKDILENKFKNVENIKRKTQNQLDFIYQENQKFDNNSNSKNTEANSNSGNSGGNGSGPKGPNGAGNKSGPGNNSGGNPRYSKDFFEGAQHFEQGFEAKDKRNVFKKWFESYKLNRKRKKTNQLYKETERDLNNRFFKDILGEKNIARLRRVSKDQKRATETQMVQDMINGVNNSRYEIENYKGFLNQKDREEIFKRNNITEEFYENYKRQIDQAEILRKLKLKQEAEENIKNRIESVDNELTLKRKRKRYSAYIEKDINYTKSKIEKLKARNLYGDKAEIKRLEERLKELNKIPREKDNKVVKFTKELLKKRRKALETPESKAKREEIKNVFLKNLKENGGGAIWSAFQAVVVGPLKAAGEGLSNMSFGAFMEALGSELAGHGGETISKLFKFGRGTLDSAYKGSKVFITGK